MNKAPLVNILLPLVGGILLANWIHWPLWVWLILLITLLSATTFFTFHRKKYFYEISFYSFWIALGLVLTILHNPLRHTNHYAHFVHPNATVKAVVTAAPQTTLKSIKVLTEVLVYDSISTQGKLILFVQPSPKALQINYGDTLFMKISLQLPSAESNPYQFNYQRYLQYRKIYYQAYLSSDNYSLIQGNPLGLKTTAILLRKRLIDNIQQLNLSSNQKGIVEALFLGWDENLQDSSRKQFRDAGLAHLLCVSGLHVGIVAGILGFLLIGLGRGPRMRIVKGIVKLIGVWLFAMLSGFAPATTRAALMFSFFIVGHMFLIQRNSYNTLAASALILLSCNSSLLYDVGFQLSYTAVFGILSMASPLYKLIPWKDKAILEANQNTLSWQQRLMRNIPIQLSQLLWRVVTLTLSAQISVLPLTLYYFHQFPTYFLISNVTIVPLAGILLLTIMLSVFCFGWMLPVKLLSLELTFIDSVTQWISQLPYASMTHIYFDKVMLISLILVITLFVIYLHTHRIQVTISILLPLLVLTVYSRIQQVQTQQQQFFIIYDTGKYPAIELFSGKQSTLLSNSTVFNNPSLIDYQSENLLTMRRAKRCHTILLDTCHYLRMGKASLFIVDSTNQWSRSSSHPDYLLLEANPHLTIHNLSNRIHFDTLILGTNNSYYHLSKWQQECDSLQIPYYDIFSQGAFVRHVR